VLICLISLHKDFLHSNPFTESGDPLHKQFANPLSLIAT
jgi:hypothetical protein